MSSVKIPEVQASRIEYRDAAKAFAVAEAIVGEARKNLEVAELTLAAAGIRLARSIGSAPEREVIFREGRREKAGRVVGIKGHRLVIESADEVNSMELDCSQVIPSHAHKSKLVGGR